MANGRRKRQMAPEDAVHNTQLIAEAWLSDHPYFAYVGEVKIAYRPRAKSFLLALYDARSGLCSRCRVKENDLTCTFTSVDRIMEVLALAHKGQTKGYAWGLEPTDITYEPTK